MTTMTALPPSSIDHTEQPAPLELEPDVFPIDLISVDGNNHRPNGNLESLVASMARQGLLQPIVVGRLAEGGKLFVIFGHRRLAAAKKLGWTEIDALDAGIVDPGIVEEVRTTENVHRLALNPMEEADAVKRVVDRWNGNIKFCATQIFGSSEKWVRDRVYLAGFKGKARELTASGRLSPAQARAIAKVTDEKLRNELAEQAAGGGAADSQPMRMVQLERIVGSKMRSLDRVAWNLDVPFGGCPACAGCPSNSVTDPLLFESKDIDPKRASCSNETCFVRKMAAAEKAIDGAVAKLEQRSKKGGDVELTISAAREVTPVGIKEQTVLRQAKRDQAPESPAPKKNLTPARVANASKQINAWDFEREWRDMMEKKRSELVKALALRIRTVETFEALCVANTLGAMRCRGFGPKQHQDWAAAIGKVLAGDYDVGEQFLELKGATELDTIGRSKEFNDLEWLHSMIPYQPGPDFFKLLGVPTIIDMEKYVAQRMAEAKKDAAVVKPAMKKKAKRPAVSTQRPAKWSSTKCKPRVKRPAAKKAVKKSRGAR